MLLNILLTGAAGLLGGEVAAHLVKAGHAVTALVRRNRAVCANDGAAVPVAGIVGGDITAARLGLDEAEYDRLTAQADMVVHCAASVRFDLTDVEYHETNVAGTQNVIAFARDAGAQLLHVSTAYVCGAREGIILETDALPANGFANGYEASKAAGEAAVRASGIPYIIARPSIITGHSATGAIRQFDTTYALFRLLAEGRVKHVPAAESASFDFVPIDHVAGGIAALVHQFEAAEGKAFHLVAERPLELAEFAGVIAGYPQFTAPELVDAAAFDPGELPSRERRLYARGVAPYASYFTRGPVFDDSVLRTAIGIAPPSAGPAYFKRLVDYCVAQNFLKGDVVLEAAS